MIRRGNMSEPADLHTYCLRIQHSAFVRERCSRTKSTSQLWSGGSTRVPVPVQTPTLSQSKAKVCAYVCARACAYLAYQDRPLGPNPTALFPVINVQSRTFRSITLLPNNPADHWIKIMLKSITLKAPGRRLLVVAEGFLI